MYKESRSVANASSPQMWAANFAASKIMSPRICQSLEKSHTWDVVRRAFPNPARILDAGCGFGEWVYFLGTKGHDATGLDYSDELVERLRAAYPKLMWLQSDIRNTSLPGDSFDGIISWGVIEHDEAGPHEALKEFLRLLKEGGKIVVTVPKDSRRQRRSSEIQFPYSSTNAFFQYFMTEVELGFECSRAGFRVEETGSIRNGSVHLLAPRVYRAFRALGVRGADRLAAAALSPFETFHNMVYCVARKPASPAGSGGITALTSSVEQTSQK